MHPFINIAIKAARRAGQIISHAARNLSTVKIVHKEQHDFVTDVDHQAEEAIINIIREAYPQHAILAEESGRSGESEYTWIIDPLDGTTNFLHDFPHYAISIALQHKDSIMHAVVYDPTRNDLFFASRGSGAFLNDRRIRVSECKQWHSALIGTGFPYKAFDRIEPYMAILRELMQKASGLRRPGCASLDLAYVASGRFDAFYELSLSPWDIAAGSLLITEAGGLVSDPHGEARYLESGDIVAGNPKLFGMLLRLVSQHLYGRMPDKNIL